MAQGGLLWLLAILLLSGCVGPQVPVANLDAISPVEREAIARVQVYEPAHLSSLQAKPIGTLEGISCRNKLWDPLPTEAVAIAQLRYQAAKRGANGLSQVQCGEPRGTSLIMNCWSSIHCTGQAFRVTPR